MKAENAHQPKLFCKALRVLLLFGLTLLTARPVFAQVTVMEDNFTHNLKDITGHAPSKGSGTWTTYYGKSPSKENMISTDGTKAIIATGDGTSIANFEFDVRPKTFYTLTGTFLYNGPVTPPKDCWAALGFACQTDVNGAPESINPWMLLRPQKDADDTPGTCGMIGTTLSGSGNAPAAAYASPPASIVLTMTWNTGTGEVTYALNGQVFSDWTKKTTLPGGQAKVYFQGFKTGSAVNVKTISLTAKTVE